MLTISDLSSPIHSSQDSFIVKSRTTIHVLPDELLLKIFKILNLQDGFSTSLVCYCWKKIASDSATIYGQYLKEINMIKSFPSLPAKSSAWTPMPQHWRLITRENILKFSSIHEEEDLLTFYPSFCKQSSKFFSFTSPTPFCDRYILLGQHGTTYFLTPQEQTSLNVELPTDLQPLASHQLVAINIQDPRRKCEFSLLRNLPPSSDHLTRCQIRYCFPMSEDNIVLITTGGEISFWNLSNEVPHCYKEIQIESNSQVYKIGNQLVLDQKIVNLDDFSLINHEFDFKNEKIKTFKSSLCAYNKNKINYFIVNSCGLLEKMWELNVDSLNRFLSQNNDPILHFSIQDMNEKFLLLTYWQSQTISILILTTQGELSDAIAVELLDVELTDLSLYTYPIFAHLSDNFLIYKHPQKYTINFRHLPTQTCIPFEWRKSIYDLPLLLGGAIIQDIRLSKGKLTLLFSSGHKPLSNQPVKFRLIQFDSQDTYQEKWQGMLNRIYSFVKDIYYAFPAYRT